MFFNLLLIILLLQLLLFLLKFFLRSIFLRSFRFIILLKFLLIFKHVKISLALFYCFYISITPQNRLCIFIINFLHQIILKFFQVKFFYLLLFLFLLFFLINHINIRIFFFSIDIVNELINFRRIFFIHEHII